MLILFLLISLLSLAPPTIAADNFTSEQQIVYQINHLGHASVRQTVTLTNNYSEIYAKEYQISLSIPQHHQHHRHRSAGKHYKKH